MNQNKKIYKTEREGQIEFFDNYGTRGRKMTECWWRTADGVYNGVLFEFKLNINDLNKDTVPGGEVSVSDETEGREQCRRLLFWLI